MCYKQVCDIVEVPQRHEHSTRREIVEYNLPIITGNSLGLNQDTYNILRTTLDTNYL